MNDTAASKLPVFAFHALGLDGRAFDPLTSGLRDGRRLVAPNHLGHGRDAGAASHLLNDHVARAVELVRKGANSGAVHLVGHSFGGVVAALACAQLESLGQTIATLSLLGTPARGGKVFEDRAEGVLLEGVAAFERMTMARWFGESPSRDWEGHIDYASRSLRSRSEHEIASTWRALASFDGFEALPLRCSVLCIAAGDDLSTPPAVMSQIVDALNARGNASLETLPDGGHLFPLTKACGVAQLLEQHWAAAEAAA